MGVIRRQSVAGTIWLYLGQGLGLLNKLVLFPLVFAGQESYWGVMAFLLSVSTLLGGVSTLGFNRVITRFAPQNPESAGFFVRKALVWSGVGGLATLIFTGALLGKVADFSSNSSLTSEFGLLLLLFLVGQWLFEMGNSIFTAFHKAQFGLFANNVSIRVIQSVLLLLCVWGGLSVSSFLWLTGLSMVVNHGILFFLALRLSGVKTDMPSTPLPTMKTMGDYAFFMVVLTLVSQSFLQLDAILVGHFLVFSQLAFLDLAKNLSSVLDMSTRALGPAAFASLSKLMAHGSYEEVGAIYVKGSFVQLFLGLVMFSTIAIHMDVLVSWLPHTGYAIIKPLFYILALGKMVDLATGLNWAIITNSEKYWVNLRVGLVTLVAIIGLEVWLIPAYGLLGAAWGVVAAYALNNGLRTWYVHAQFGLRPFQRLHLRLLPMVVVSVVALMDWPLPLIPQIIAKDVLLLGVFFWYMQKGRTIPEWDDFLQYFWSKMKSS